METNSKHILLIKWRIFILFIFCLHFNANSQNLIQSEDPDDILFYSYTQAYMDSWQAFSEEIHEITGELQQFMYVDVHRRESFIKGLIKNKFENSKLETFIVIPYGKNLSIGIGIKYTPSCNGCKKMYQIVVVSKSNGDFKCHYHGIYSKERHYNDTNDFLEKITINDQNRIIFKDLYYVQFVQLELLDGVFVMPNYELK